MHEVVSEWLQEGLYQTLGISGNLFEIIIWLLDTQSYKGRCLGELFLARLSKRKWKASLPVWDLSHSILGWEAPFENKSKSSSVSDASQVWLKMYWPWKSGWVRPQIDAIRMMSPWVARKELCSPPSKRIKQHGRKIITNRTKHTEKTLQDVEGIRSCTESQDFYVWDWDELSFSLTLDRLVYQRGKHNPDKDSELLGSQ